MLQRLNKFRFDVEILAFVILLGWLTALVLSQANPYLTAPGRDSGFFLYAGSRILAGDKLYVDIWDHKGPGIFLVNALGLLMAKNSRWGVWFLEYISIFGAFYCGYFGLRKKWGLGAVLTGTLAGLYVLNRVLVKGNLTEEYPLLFNFLAIALFVRGNKHVYLNYLLIGMTFGLSFMFRVNNAGSQVGIGLTVLILSLYGGQFKEGFKKLLSIALGAILLFLLTCLSFYANGTLNDFITGAFIYNFQDVKEKSNMIVSAISGVQHLGGVSVLVIAGYMMAAIQVWKVFRQKEKSTKDLDLVVLLVILLPLEIYFSSLSGRNYIHYYICWVPVVFISAAYAYSALSEMLFSAKVLQFFSLSRSLSVITIVSLLFSYPVVIDYVSSAQRILFNRQNGIDYVDKLSSYVRENTGQNDSVLMWGGQTGANFMSRRKSPTRYTFYPAFSINPMTELISKGFFDDLKNNKPILIVDFSKKNPDNLLSIDQETYHRQLKDNPGKVYVPYLIEVLEYINNHYVFETSVDGYAVYRIK